ncbi:MAG: prolipoprotein diacylglyceryl transferase [Firmicutes bacterium]|jgi:phosphatidylglycerol:prolipoprotein diacylglycerol transferase|nr:prolipoprotein diacylglyceryl transferase [Bacillota bacterium]
MRPILFSLGPINVYSWGLLLAVATAGGIVGAMRLARSSGWERPDHIVDVAVGAVLAGVVGSRLNYLLLYERAEFFAHPVVFFQFSSGGLIFHGGLFLGVIVGGILAWRYRLGFWETGDVLVPFLAAGYGLVRIGCFLNGCCYGRPSSLPWAVAVPILSDGVLRHPAQLYAAIMGLILGAVLLWFFRRRPFPGAVFLAYAFGSALERIIEDFFRDTLMYTQSLTLAQLVSLMIMAAAVALYIVRWRYFCRAKHLGTNS